MVVEYSKKDRSCGTEKRGGNVEDEKSFPGCIYSVRFSYPGVRCFLCIQLKCERIVLKDLLLPYFVSVYLIKTEQEAEKLSLKSKQK